MRELRDKGTRTTGVGTRAIQNYLTPSSPLTTPSSPLTTHHSPLTTPSSPLATCHSIGDKLKERNGGKLYQLLT